MMKKIMVIEDDFDQAELLKVNLSKKGWDVVAISDGYKAVTTLVNDSPDLILLDLNLPYLDGDMVISVFNEKKLTDKIPVIIISAKEESEIKKAQEKIKAAAYFKKPVDFDKLAELIKKFI